MVGRSLKAAINLEDYDGPTANRGHDPSWKAGGAPGGHVGRNG